MPRIAELFTPQTSQLAAGQFDRSIPMATPSGQFVPTPPTESQLKWDGGLSNPSIANILYGAGEAAYGLVTSPLPYAAGMVGSAYGAMTGQDPKATGARFEQATTFQPQTPTGQYYSEQIGEKLGSLPPVVSGIPLASVGKGSARYAAEQYAAPLAEKSLTMYEQGKLTPGMTPISQMADDSYRGSHKAPNATVYGATLDNLGGIMPANVYTREGKNLYGSGDPVIDRDWWMIAMKAKGKPDYEVEVYRAVPKGVTDINSGDWVTTSKKYAENHGENALNGEYDLISAKVKANTLSSEGYPYEFGYNVPENK